MHSAKFARALRSILISFLNLLARCGSHDVVRTMRLHGGAHSARTDDPTFRRMTLKSSRFDFVLYMF